MQPSDVEPSDESDVQDSKTVKATLSGPVKRKSGTKFFAAGVPRTYTKRNGVTCGERRLEKPCPVCARVYVKVRQHIEHTHKHFIRTDVDALMATIARLKRRVERSTASSTEQPSSRVGYGSGRVDSQRVRIYPSLPAKKEI